MASTAASRPKPSTSKDVQWFKPDITDINPAFRALMEDYSKIPAEQVKSHIVNVVSIQSLSTPLAVKPAESAMTARESMANVSLSLHRPV